MSVVNCIQTQYNGNMLYSFISGTGSLRYNSNTTVSVVVVGGGGGGGGGANGIEGTGGGGGGGVGVGTLTFLSGVTYTVNVGVGGNAGLGGSTDATVTAAKNGNNSSIVGGVINEIANGGGRGGSSSGTKGSAGSGGSGGGSDGGWDFPGNPGGSTKGSGSRLTYYGTIGGNGFTHGGGGGGGGASVKGGNSVSYNGGDGGNGYTWTINGSVYGGGGGGGSSGTTYGSGTGGIGGIGGGGSGGGTSSTASTDGLINTGGGGGGAYGGKSSTNFNGGAGGSGIVVVYGPAILPFTVGTVPTITSVTPGLGNITVKFNQSDNATPSPYYYYNVNGNTFGNTTYNSNAYSIVIGNLTSAVNCNIGLMGVSVVGNTDIYYANQTPYIIGSTPTINSITPGLGNLTVNFSPSTNYNPSPYYYYNVNGNTFGNSTLSNNANSFVITGLSNAISTNIGLMGVSSVGNTAISYLSQIPYIIGTTPNISSVTPGLGNLTVNFRQSTNANPAPYYYYNVNGNTFGNSTYNSNATSIVIGNLTSITSNIGLQGISIAGNTGVSYYTANTYLIGTDPIITSVTPGLGNLTVRFNRSTNANPIPYYYYNVNGNTFANTTYNSNSSAIVIGNLTTAINCNIGLLGVSTVGNTNTVYASSMPYLIGTTPTITSIVPGTGNLAVYFNQSTNANPVPYYYYSYNGGTTFANSTYNSNATPILITGLTANSYTIQVKGVSAVGNTSVSSTVGYPNLLGNTPTLSTVNGAGKITVTYSQSIAGTGSTNWYYSLNNGLLVSAPASPFDISGSLLTGTSPYSIYVLARNPAGDISSNTITGNVLGSTPTIVSLTPGINKISVTMNQSTIGTLPTSYYYSYFSNGSNRIGPVTYPSFDISGLTNTTPYTVYVVASNPAGNLVSSGGSATPNVFGTTPSIGSITSGLNSLTVNFAGSTGGYPSPTYYYSYSSDGSSRLGPVTSPFTITGLTNASPYTIYVVASNTAGNLVSTGVSQTPNVLGTVPSVTSVTPGLNKLTVAFTGSTGGYPSPTYYYSYSSNGSSRVGPVTSPFDINGISGLKTVYVVASNAAGNLVSTGSSGTPYIIGTAPVINTITPGKNSLIVDFSGSTGSIPSPTTYLYSVDGVNYIDGKTTTSPITIGNLKISKVYNVTLIAQNLGGRTLASNSVGEKPTVTSSSNKPTAFFSNNSHWTKTSIVAKSYWGKR